MPQPVTICRAGLQLHHTRTGPAAAPQAHLVSGVPAAHAVAHAIARAAAGLPGIPHLDVPPAIAGPVAVHAPVRVALGPVPSPAMVLPLGLALGWALVQGLLGVPAQLHPAGAAHGPPAGTHLPPAQTRDCCSLELAAFSIGRDLWHSQGQPKEDMLVPVLPTRPQPSQRTETQDSSEATQAHVPALDQPKAHVILSRRGKRRQLVDSKSWAQAGLPQRHE